MRWKGGDTSGRIEDRRGMGGGAIAGGGLGVGVASVVVPAYIAELAPAQLRGRLGSLQQLAIVTGIFLALLANYAIAQAAGDAGDTWWLGEEAWRWMFWSEAIPAPGTSRRIVSRTRARRAAWALRSVAFSKCRHWSLCAAASCQQ